MASERMNFLHLVQYLPTTRAIFTTYIESVVKSVDFITIISTLVQADFHCTVI